MKVYLVGGAVRDRLLGREAGDRDFVVVGATAEQMLAQGYRPVGKDFPVFLHPRSGEEYALARTERKTGPGYHGFAVHAAPEVTLEQDLERRDLTINAIAQGEDGTLIDPFGGIGDLQARRLRHVSMAFVEDPLRVLRVARFLARFAPLGFEVHDSTLALMRQIVASGELRHLVAERVWQETRRALGEAQPAAFVRCLRGCGALAQVLPEVDALYGVPQRAEHHPEVDTGVHLELCLQVAAKLAPGDALIGFATLCHDLGKALTPPDALPAHIGHEHAGLAPLRALCARVKVPAEHRDLAELACREHLNVHRIAELRPDTVYKLLERCDAFRRPHRIEQLGLVCEIDKRGRAGREDREYSAREQLRGLHAAALAVGTQQLDIEGLSGEAIGAKLRQARIAAIRTARGADARDGSRSAET